jgi:hypothetical protein
LMKILAVCNVCGMCRIKLREKKGFTRKLCQEVLFFSVKPLSDAF